MLPARCMYTLTVMRWPRCASSDDTLINPMACDRGPGVIAVKMLLHCALKRSVIKKSKVAVRPHVDGIRYELPCLRDSLSVE